MDTALDFLHDIAHRPVRAGLYTLAVCAALLLLAVVLPMSVVKVTLLVLAAVGLAAAGVATAAVAGSRLLPGGAERHGASS